MAAVRSLDPRLVHDGHGHNHRAPPRVPPGDGLTADASMRRLTGDVKERSAVGTASGWLDDAVAFREDKEVEIPDDLDRTQGCARSPTEVRLLR